MNTLIKTSLLLLLFSQSIFAQNSFTPIPTPPHTREVEVFLKGEMPKEPYLRTRILEVNTTRNESINQLLIMLKTKAQGAGADGVMISEDLGQTGNRLVGIGIKYKKNITYLDSLRLLKKVVFINFDKAQKDDFVTFDLSGAVKTSSRAEAVNLYHNLLERLDFEFLVNDRSPNWHTELRNNSSLINKRTFYVNNQPKMNVFFGYEGTKLKELKVKTNHTDILVGQFDAKGLPMTVSIYRNEKLYNRVNYTYDAEGKTALADWHIYSEGKEKPFLRVEYSYFSNADVKL